VADVLANADLRVNEIVNTLRDLQLGFQMQFRNLWSHATEMVNAVLVMDASNLISGYSDLGFYLPPALSNKSLKLSFKAQKLQNME